MVSPKFFKFTLLLFDRKSNAVSANLTGVFQVFFLFVKHNLYFRLRDAAHLIRVIDVPMDMGYACIMCG